MIRNLLLLLALAMVSATAVAQDAKQATVHLRNGQVITGTITSRNDQQVTVISRDDSVTYVFGQEQINYIEQARKKKNYDTSKFRGFIDAGYSLGTGSPRSDYWLVETSFGYQVTPHWYLGAGLGVHNFHARKQSYPLYYDQTGSNAGRHEDPDWKYPFIPVYLNGRFNFKSESHNTPFVDLKAGVMFINHNGCYVSPTLGYHLATNQFFSINFGIGYAMHTAKYEKWVSGDTPGAIPDDSGHSYLNQRDHYTNFFLKVGVEF